MKKAKRHSNTSSLNPLFPKPDGRTVTTIPGDVCVPWFLHGLTVFRVAQVHNGDNTVRSTP